VTPDSVSVARRKGYHTFYLDLETEGLTSKFWSKALGSDPMNVRRSRLGMPRISEIALRGASSSFNVFGYTDIVTKDLLERHGVTKRQLRNINARLPAGLYRELIGSMGPAQWDPSVAIEGSVLNKVLRRHGRHAMRSRTQQTSSLISKVIGSLEKASTENQVTLTGWNITGFDLPVMFGNASAEQASRLSNLIRSGAVNIQEGAENYYRILFNRLVHGGHVPMITDRAALNAAGGVKILNAQQAGLYLQRNQPLSEFADDIRQNISGKDSFQRRASLWAQSFKGTSREKDAARIASQVARRLSSVKDYESYQRLIRRAHLGHGSYMRGWRQSFYEVVGDFYKNKGFEHIHVLGDVEKVRGDVRVADKLTSSLSTRTMAGKVNALQFVLGGEQEQVAESMIRAMRDINPRDPRLAELTRAVRGAHTGSRDTRALEIVSGLLAPKPENRAILQAFEQHHFDKRRLEEIYTRRVARLSEDQGVLGRVNEILAQGQGPAARKPGTKASARRTFLTTTKRRLRTVFRTRPDPMKGMLRAGAAIAGAALLFGALGPDDEDLQSEETKKRMKKRMEGIRRPMSMYRSVEGIDPSEMDHANVSQFHSGANVWDGLMTASFLGNEQGWNNPYFRESDPYAGFKSSGIQTHKDVQAYLLQNGLVEDVEIPVRQWGISSTIDAMLAGGIPLEIKSRTSQRLIQGMTDPRGKDVGQINFDILATGAPYGYLAYASAEEPTKFKLFKILPDPARLALDNYFLETRMAADQRIPGRSILHLMGRKISAAAASLQEYVIGSLGVSNQEYDETAAEDPLAGMVSDTVYAGDPNVAADHYAPPQEQDTPHYVNYDNAYHPLSMAGSPNLSRIRDYKTQLHRLPGLPRTYRGRNRHINTASITEY
jgi:hypothetical protein